MKVPKYIKDLLYRRAKAGELISRLDGEFWECASKNNLDDVLYQEDTSGFYCINSIALIVEPQTLSDRQIEIIENYKGENENESS
jgi:hypothetical protein